MSINPSGYLITSLHILRNFENVAYHVNPEKQVMVKSCNRELSSRSSPFAGWYWRPEL